MHIITKGYECIQALDRQILSINFLVFRHYEGGVNFWKEKCCEMAFTITLGGGSVALISGFLRFVNFLQFFTIFHRNKILY